ncbi:MAG: diacylglycerol kinase family protein [Massilia sp.]
MKEVKNVAGPQRFTLAARLKSFSYAFEGVWFMLKTQHNAWLHGVATLLVIALGVYLKVSASDWRWLAVAMAMVWVAETLNTAVEYVCDVVSPHYSEAVKHAKDISAGGVLIAAACALLVGVLTLLPYFR